jgi:hypothetical protein
MPSLGKLHAVRPGRLILLCLAGALAVLSLCAAPAAAAPYCWVNSPESADEYIQDSVERPVDVTCSSSGGGVSYAVKSTTTAAGGTVSDVQMIPNCCGDTYRGVKYTPKAGYTGPDSFVFTATDATGSTEVTRHLKVVPHAPPACVDYPRSFEAAAAVRSGTTKVVWGSCSSSTDGLSGMVVKVESQPAQGSVTATGDGTTAQFRFTAAAGQTGTFSFTYSATNAYGKSNVATVKVDVSATANEPARCWPPTETRTRNTATRTIHFACYDEDGDKLTYRIAEAGGPAHGTLGAITQPAGNSTWASVAYTPTAGYVGADEFTFVADDGFAASEPVAVPIDVKATDFNTVPTCREPYAKVKVQSGAVAYIDPGCFDDESDPITYKVDDPAHGTLEVQTMPYGAGYVALKYTPDSGYKGEDSISFVASDGFGDSLPSVHEVEVTEPDPPTCTPPGTPVAVRPGKTKPVYISCYAAVGGQPTPTITQQPEHGTLTQDFWGYAYTPEDGYTGPDSFKFTASNSVGKTPEYTFALNVTPDANEAPSCSTEAGSSGPAVHMRANASRTMSMHCYDTDQDPLTRTIVDPPDHGELVPTGTGALTPYKYTPDAGYVGPDSYSFKANDGRADSSVATQSITIHEADWNSVPVCSGHPIATEGNQTIWLSPYCSDGQNDRLTYEIIDQPAHGTVKVTTENEGTFWSWTVLKYTPETGYAGTDSFTFVADDGFGKSAKTTINLTLTKPAPPTCRSPGAVSWRSGLRRFLDAACYGGPGGGPVKITITDQPDHGTLTTNSWGDFVYTSDAAYEGAESFAYKAENAAGESAVQTQVVNLAKEYNTAPTCGNNGLHGPYSVRSGAQRELPVFCFDYEGDRLTYSVVDEPDHGSLSPITLEPGSGWQPGRAIYTAADGYLGSDSFTVRASDGRAESAGTTTTTLKVIAAGANTAPRCTIGSGTGVTFMLAQNRTFEIDDQLAWFCHDAEADPLTMKVVDGPQHGTLSDPVDGVRTYTPAAAYLGLDTIMVQVNDGRADAADLMAIRFQITKAVDVVPQPVEAPDGGTVNVNAYTGNDGRAVITVPSGEVAEFPAGCMPLTVKTPIDPAGGQISDPVLVLEPSDDNPKRVEAPLAGGSLAAKSDWTGTIPCVESGDLFVEYLLTDGDEQLPVRVPVGGLVLIDPQGVVYDKAKFDAAKAAGKTDEQARGEAAIEGATAVLQRRVDGQWKKVLAGDPGIKPNVNPQVTGANGLFQWDVSEGTYRVVVSKEGYETVTSDAVDIPPPVLDLHIAMTRKKAPVEDGGGGGTGDGGGGGTPSTKPPVTTPEPPVTPPVPCAGLTGLKRASCQADLRYAKATGKCAKLKGKKKASCVKKAKLERKRAIARAKCDALTGKKKAACVKAAKKIKK